MLQNAGFSSASYTFCAYTKKLQRKKKEKFEKNCFKLYFTEMLKHSFGNLNTERKCHQKIIHKHFPENVGKMNTIQIMIIFRFLICYNWKTLVQLSEYESSTKF